MEAARVLGRRGRGVAAVLEKVSSMFVFAGRGQQTMLDRMAKAPPSRYPSIALGQQRHSSPKPPKTYLALFLNMTGNLRVICLHRSWIVRLHADASCLVDHDSLTDRFETFCTDRSICRMRYEQSYLKCPRAITIPETSKSGV